METIEVFLARYPEFASIDPSFIQLLLDENSDLYDSLTWGKHTQKAIFLLTAHQLLCRWETIAKMAGNATAIASGQAPQPGSANESYLQSTIYGRQLEALVPVPGFI